ncbi:MAG: calcium-translocating P-type ATPase, PMCA-type [Lentisphaeria bacterium]|nr:calcium-translocating P-type ATPase, PMCA-type [Lentisphaeria bacterium]
MEWRGLNDIEVAKSREKYGTNALTHIPPEPLWVKVLNGFKDPMIVILLVALAVQLVLFLFGQAHWYEAAGVFIAIIIANGVASLSECSQEKKASLLKLQEEAGELAKVIRNGVLQECHVSDLVVGDVVSLQAGDKIPADGILLEKSVKVDQASLNGETEEAEKIVCPDNAVFDVKDLLNPYYIYRGTVVAGGEAFMEVKVVGDRTLFGELALEVQEESRKTPLQVKLGKLAKQISIFGYAGAMVIILGILGKHILTGDIPHDFIGWVKMLLNIVTVAVTIIVCAVPEGLPMLTSILLAMQSLKMAKDNVLVRKINGLETAGSLNLLYSDKTGTITEGRLSVVELVTGSMQQFDCLKNMHGSLKLDILNGIGLNNSASVGNGSVIGGNSTDRALMAFLLDEEIAHTVDRQSVMDFDPFDSAKKYSKVTVKSENKSVSYIKGAPEKIIEKCSFCLDSAGNQVQFEDKNPLIEYIDAQAARSMRLLAVAKCEGTQIGEACTLVAVISIRDNVRAESVEAIQQVKNASVQVVMVTGDRKETAVAIAKEASLLEKDSDIAMSSAELAEKTDDELKKLLPDLRVVARALPTDKSRLVRVAQELDYVVGMTGDGVNDSPALKKADVGFAMGSGTEVAKEAGDITILDDNFLSIEKAILYGRTMFKNIRKFLIFQLTVNVAAVLTCCLGPFLGEDVVLTVVQLLIINLAMDTLVAIAFGSEPPVQEYMQDKPVKRDAGMITGNMAGEILLGSLYITCISLGILFFAPLRELFGDVSMTYLKSAVFATFMMAITFNGFNARTEDINPFKRIGSNPNFLLIMLLIFALQYLFVTFGGKTFGVESLSLHSWGICLALALLIIPLDMIRKIVLKGLKKA